MKITAKDLMTIRAMEAKYGMQIARPNLLRDADGKESALHVKVPASLRAALKRIEEDTRISADELTTLALMEFIESDNQWASPKSSKAKPGAKPKTTRAAPRRNVNLNDDEVRAWHAANGGKIDTTAKHFHISWHRAKAIVTSAVVEQPAVQHPHDYVPTP